MLETETYINRKFYQNQINMENDVLKAIKERRSIRRFKADQITDEELKTVLELSLIHISEPTRPY